MGAVSADGTSVSFSTIVAAYAIEPKQFDALLHREHLEAQRRELAYRDRRVRPPLQDKTVVLVDDGLATGSTMCATVASLRKHHPRQTVVAVPVGAAETCETLRARVDRIVCLVSPEPFHAVGLYYDNFGQTSDDEVRALLADAYARPHSPS